MTRRTLALRCLALALTVAVHPFASLGAQTDKTTTVIVVRHAEKAAEPAADPPLTAVGEQRAKDLAAALKDAGVGAIITTQFARTRGTAAALATALGLTPEVVTTSSPTHVKDVAAAARMHAGKTVLVVGHSNTVPAIIAALGAKQPAAICDAEHDNLFVVTVRADGQASVVAAKYGARTPPEPGCGGMK